MPTAYNRGKSMNAEKAPAGPPPEGVKLVEPNTGGMQGKYADEVDEFLHTTDRPDEPISAGATARRAPIPPGTDAWLPKLVQAAREPGAPLELQQFLRMVRDMMGAR